MITHRFALAIGGLATIFTPQSLFLSSAIAQAAPAEIPRAQRYAKLELIDFDGYSYFVQRTADDRLALTPNESFFDGVGLTARGQGAENLPAQRLNGGKSFRSIRGFTADNSVSWYLYITTPGTVEVRLQSSKPRRFSWRCNEQSGSFSSVSKLSFSKVGVYRFIVQATAKTSATIDFLDIEGPEIKGAGVVRTRWRPSAAHTRFVATGTKGKSHLWIMEMDGVPSEASSYAPVTTPFGYFGSSWTKAGKPTGLNFSMWSYSRKAKEPPVEQLSHLIAVGNPSASFGHFGHEGTGVKVRDWNPFSDWQGQSCVYALRLVPGTPYDTYYGYYFDEKTTAWRLFAAGRKFRSTSKTRRRTKNGTLSLGSFVEVPGPPQRQRSGHIVRSMRYRGFMRDAAGTWHPIDQMKGEGKAGQAQNRHRRLLKDLRFEMSTGGMRQEGVNPTILGPSTADLSDLPWMEPEALKTLLTVPTEIRCTGLTYAEGSASLDLEIRGIQNEAGARVYFGDEDGLTIAERWAQSYAISDLREGTQRISWPADVAPNKVRMLVENTAGRFWSDATLTRRR